MCQSTSMIRPARISTSIWNGLRKLIVIYTFALCGSCAQVGTEVSQPEVRFEPIESWLDEHVESFEYNDMPISVLIGYISYHIPICFEGAEFRKDQVKWIRDQRGHVTNVIVYPPKYNVSFQNISYRTLIDRVVGLDNTLQWKIMPNGVINVFPRGDKNNEYINSILNPIIPRLDVENVELVHLLSNGQPFGRTLGKYGLSWVHFVKGQDLVGTKKISVHLKDATIRECLNAVVKSVGDNFYWHVMGLIQRGKSINGEEIDYRWYGVGQTYSRSPEYLKSRSTLAPNPR